ncbi:MAG: hypothetical protein M3Z31_12340 [Pseudomonadota bacterium]|nr:hypothetical protein [Pseudomonadota bacterium]
MATPTLPLNRTSAEHRFFTWIAVAILATVLLGFARSFFLRPLFPDWPAPQEAVFYIHGAAFTGWIVLLLVQASLVANGRTDLHRRIGVLGAVLAALMVVLGTFAALVAARRATGFVGIPIPPLQFLAVPLFDTVIFAIFVSLGIAQRRNPQSHKRWILLATIEIITAAIARWPGVATLGPPAFFGITDLFVIALGVWDWRTRGRLHRVTLWGGLALILSQPLRLIVSGTEAWLAFARWATGLLG